LKVSYVFYSAGLILNGKRTSLAPSKLNYCTFIHDNDAAMMRNNWSGYLFARRLLL